MILAVAKGDWVWWASDLAVWSGVVFALLVFVLAAFALKPILAAMRQRQEQILATLSRAEAAREEARRLIDKQDAERTKSRALARSLVKEAKADAERTHRTIVERAKDEAERARQRSERETGLLAQKAMHELWMTTTDLSTRLAERILARALSEEDQRRLVDEAIADVAATVGGAV